MLEIMYFLLDSKGGQVSQDSILTKFGTGSRGFHIGYTIPGGSGGIAPIELLDNKSYKQLSLFVKEFSSLYRRILKLRCTTNLTNGEIAKDQRVPHWMVKDILEKIYTILKEKLCETTILGLS